MIKCKTYFLPCFVSIFKTKLLAFSEVTLALNVTGNDDSFHGLMKGGMLWDIVEDPLLGTAHGIRL